MRRAPSCLLVVTFVAGCQQAQQQEETVFPSSAPVVSPPENEPRQTDNPPAWYQLDEVADEEGALIGYTLSAGWLGSAPTKTIDLPSEAFAAGPFGDLIVFGGDDGESSELNIVDVRSGQVRTVARSPDTIRRATMDVARGTIFYLLLQRDSRRELGIFRIPVEGGDPAVAMLPFMWGRDQISDEAGEDGLIFSTQLTWSSDSAQLAVQSCGETRCATRVLDVVKGELKGITERAHGDLLHVDEQGIIAYDTCAGLPCAVVRIGYDSSEQVLVPAALHAVVTGAGPQALLVHEVFNGEVRELRSKAIATGQERTLMASMPDEMTLLASPDRAFAATTLPDGHAMVVLGGERLFSLRGLQEPARIVSALDGQLYRVMRSVP